MKKNIAIVIPVYNDFSALEILIRKLEEAQKRSEDLQYSLCVVDDGSLEPLSITSSLFKTETIHLHRNIGHQKAIATGLAHIHHNYKNYDSVLIMDGDGEDRPEDIAILFGASQKHDDKVVFASRKSRQVNLKFRLFYFVYRMLFRWLTGEKISFGNFMLIPKTKVGKLVYYSEILSHLPAAIIKSGLSYTTVPIDRGKRYNGSSKMNFPGLLLHGLGAITVFLERVASRLLVFSFILISVSLLVIISIIAIRAFTDLAIPGWASSILSSMLIILLQGFFLSLFTVFLFLSSQSQRKFIPAQHYKDYISSIQNEENG